MKKRKDEEDDERQVNSDISMEDESYLSAKRMKSQKIACTNQGKELRKERVKAVHILLKDFVFPFPARPSLA